MHTQVGIIGAGPAGLLLGQMLHENPFDYQRELADLDYIVGSKAAMTSLAENYVGLPIDVASKG